MTTLEERLHARLDLLGLRPVDRIRLTDNRSVMVSLSRTRVLSLQRRYIHAPDRVLQAIVRFVARGTPADMRKAAEHEILSFHVGDEPPRDEPAVRAERPRPGDEEALARLGLLFEDLNQRHFMGSLPTLPIRLSGRMRTRLGQLTLGKDGRPLEICISRRHLLAHGWDEATHTLLHEMVHLWQHAVGQEVDHGPRFRSKAREVGVAASARRWVTRTRDSVARRTSHEEQLTNG